MGTHLHRYKYDVTEYQRIDGATILLEHKVN